MLMMTIAWHRDHVQNDKVRIIFFLSFFIYLQTQIWIISHFRKDEAVPVRINRRETVVRCVRKIVKLSVLRCV